MPTLAELSGAKVPNTIDGISFLPTLLGRSEEQRKHAYLYWEYQGKQAVRWGDWKAYRNHIDADIELYNLEEDTGETLNIAVEHPEVVTRIIDIMKSARTESELFPLVQKKK